MAREPILPGPDHPITIEPRKGRVVVRSEGAIIADTTSALVLQEAGYTEVLYLPLSDVDQSVLKRTQTTTYCPYKGECSYFTIISHSGDIVDAVWTYEKPYPEVAPIADRVAFYPDRVDFSTD
jgi:uncharacterized protein (DUF427 family)